MNWGATISALGPKIPSYALALPNIMHYPTPPNSYAFNHISLEVYLPHLRPLCGSNPLALGGIDL